MSDCWELDIIEGNGGNLYQGPTSQLRWFARQHPVHGRQQSKRFEPPFEHSLQQPTSFTRTRWHSDHHQRRQRSRHFWPSHGRHYQPDISKVSLTLKGFHYNLSCLSSAELDSDSREPLLSVESAALPILPSHGTLCQAPFDSFNVPDGELLLLDTVSEFVPQHTSASCLSPLAPTFFPAPKRTSTCTYPLPFDHLFPPSWPILPVQPNSDPRVNHASRQNNNAAHVHSTLNCSAWAYFLQDYPDRPFVDSLLYIIDHGADIGFMGDRMFQFCPPI
ncbi:hypothetical protein GGU10DRAFT_388603 [Lentinula aff. detonsa]|uniref:Uncharacterized protein n=1 Tax=Lentinula aff. detonsa TaxID=2804958 RepID=A0AA38K9E0_9AGAR|nr:hypothetical protein GGU10DRAFT_388603 [Lentinula aff. detonsa]